MHSKLKKKYSEYQNLRQLASRYELFVVDDRIVAPVYSVLGNVFKRQVYATLSVSNAINILYRLKPIPIKIKNKSAKEIQEEIATVKKSAVYLGAGGGTAVYVPSLALFELY